MLLSTFNQVKKACFGNTCDINAYATIDCCVERFEFIYKDSSLNFPSSVKAYLLFVHLKDCLIMINDVFGSPLGLSVFTEATVCHFET